MASIGEQLVAKIAELLNASDSKPLPTVRQRPQPITAEYADGESGIDALLLYAVKEESQKQSRTTVQRTRHVRIEIPVAGPPPLDQAADALYLYIVQTLFSSDAQAALGTDGSGARFAFFMEEVGLVWETVSTYVDMSVAVLELKFTFLTALDPSVRC